MRKNRIALTIIAVAVICLAATSVYAYTEAWNGWMSSGTLTYNNNDYVHSSSGGTVFDSTYSVERDTFYLSVVGSFTIPFVYAAANDTIYLTVATPMDSTTGGKETGQVSDDAASGIWAGYGYIVSADLNFTIWGTWDGDFVYGGGTPTYTADGTRTGSNGATVYGDFDSRGSRTYYSP